jgi:hypothetical protein
MSERAPLPTTHTLPKDLAARWDVFLASQRSGLAPRACAAALGMCWPEYRSGHPYTGDVLDYGGRVINALLRQGYTMPEIGEASASAFRAVVAGLVHTPETKDPEGF